MTVENLHDAIGQLPSDLIAKVDEKRCRKTRVIPLKRYTAMAACLALILCAGWFCTRLLSLKGGSSESIAMQAADAESVLEAPAAREPEQAAPAAVSGNSAREKAAPEEDTNCASLTLETNEAGEIPTEDRNVEQSVLYHEYPINIRATQYADTRSLGTINRSSAPEIKLIRSREELDDYAQKHSDYDLEEFSACCEAYDDTWFETHDLLIVLMKDLPADSGTQVSSMLDLDDNGVWELCISYDTPEEDTTQRTDRFVLMDAKKDAITNEEAITIILE